MLCFGVQDTSSSLHPTAIMLFKYISLVVSILAIPILTASAPILKERSCTAANTLVRHEWYIFVSRSMTYLTGDLRSALSKAQRKSYTDAVLCLQCKPSLLNSTEVPGARNRYDDFLAVHINQTIYIHLSGFFLPWHRVFMRLYETALNDCGYSGAHP